MAELEGLSRGTGMCVRAGASSGDEGGDKSGTGVVTKVDLHQKQ